MSTMEQTLNGRAAVAMRGVAAGSGSGEAATEPENVQVLETQNSNCS